MTIIKSQSRILLLTQHFAALSKVQIFFFSLKVKIKTLSTTFMKTIHHPSLSLFLAVIKGQSRILLHTQHFADSPTVTMLFFFSLREQNQSFINNLSTEPLLF